MSAATAEDEPRLHIGLSAPLTTQGEPRNIIDDADCLIDRLSIEPPNVAG